MRRIAFWIISVFLIALVLGACSNGDNVEVDTTDAIQVNDFNKNESSIAEAIDQLMEAVKENDHEYYEDRVIGDFPAVYGNYATDFQRFINDANNPLIDYIEEHNEKLKYELIEIDEDDMKATVSVSYINSDAFMEEFVAGIYAMVTSTDTGLLTDISQQIMDANYDTYSAQDAINQRMQDVAEAAEEAVSDEEYDEVEIEIEFKEKDGKLELRNLPREFGDIASAGIMSGYVHAADNLVNSIINSVTAETE